MAVGGLPSAVSFEYDGLGQRTATTVAGVTTEYALDIAGGLPEVIAATTSGTTAQYVQIQGQILAQYDPDSDTWEYILPDALGSVRQLVDSAGAVTLAQSYDPFGGGFELVGARYSEFDYTGEQQESIPYDLIFLRARYYDPAVGRFLSRDTFPGFAPRPETLHSYAYVTNNPINGADPSGYQRGPAAGTAGGGIAFCFGIAFLIPEPFFIEEGICTLIALGVIAATPIVVDSIVDSGVTTEDIIHPFPRAPELDPLPPFELGPRPDPFGYSPGPPLDAGLDQALTPPGIPLDPPEPATRALDFPLVQPCLEDNVLLSQGPGQWGPRRGTGGAEYERRVREHLGGPPDQNYHYNDVAYDAWNPDTQTFVDAKDATGNWFTGRLHPGVAQHRDRRIIDEALRQVERAGKYDVEWWTNNEDAVQFLTNLFQETGIPIEVKKWP